MSPISRRTVCWKCAVQRCHTRWLVFASCGVLTLASPPVAAQVPSASREELVRQWDVNRDGKVDASEAEIARGRMRRARTDAIINSGNDPVTGKPRAAIDPVTGRSVPRDAAAADRSGLSSPADDDGLILVPGNGERPRTADSGIGGAANAAGKDSPPRPSQRDREALPGTRAPSMSSTIPSIAPRLPAGGPLPGAGQGPAAGSRPPGARPGVIAGGARASGPGARPGSGATAPPGDLNAGRLPGGLPQTRGVAPGTVAGPRLGPMQQSSAGRLAGPNPTVPRPGIGPYRGPTPPGVSSAGVSSAAAPSVGVPAVPRPGGRQPDGGRPVSPPPRTVPRVPRMTTDEFYGR